MNKNITLNNALIISLILVLIELIVLFLIFPWC